LSQKGRKNEKGKCNNKYGNCSAFSGAWDCREFSDDGNHSRRLHFLGNTNLVYGCNDCNTYGDWDYIDDTYTTDFKEDRCKLSKREYSVLD
jgi:hypothetical protein